MTVFHFITVVSKNEKWEVPTTVNIAEKDIEKQDIHLEKEGVVDVLYINERSHIFRDVQFCALISVQDSPEEKIEKVFYMTDRYYEEYNNFEYNLTQFKDEINSGRN